MKLAILFAGFCSIFYFTKDDRIYSRSLTAAIDTLPSYIKGNFEDDYGIHYTINDSVWYQDPKMKYHIIKKNNKEQYLIARNDAQNPSGANLYTRIDYMTFSNMDPWKWGFCLSVYDAKTDAEAEAKYVADRENPRKGCNG